MDFTPGAMINAQHDMEVVAQASDGVEAVDKAASTRPDVAIIDLNMPRCGGVPAIERLRTRSPNTRDAADFGGRPECRRGVSRDRQSARQAGQLLFYLTVIYMIFIVFSPYMLYIYIVYLDRNPL